MVIPEQQTVHFLVKSKINLHNIFNSDINKYMNNFPYQGIYQRGFDNYDNYYITRPLYKTEKYNSGMLCESYNINPMSTYDNKSIIPLNKNISEVLQRWRYSGIFKINHIFKNVCKLDSYIKYANEN